MKHQYFRRALGAFACTLLILAAPHARAEAELDAAFDALRSWNLGDANETPQRVIDAVTAAHGDGAARADLAARLAGLLAEDSSFEAKKIACTQLARIGTAAEVPALAALLADAESAHLARYALEKIPGAEATQALRAAWPGAAAPVAVGIVNSLGERADSAALPDLVGLLAHDDADLAGAAIAALGKFGTPEATAALRAAWTDADAARRPALADGLLACAARAASAGDALALYQVLHAESTEDRIQAAAFRGIMETDAENRVTLLADTLRNGAPRMRAEAMAYVRSVPGDDATHAFSQLLDDVEPATAALLIRALADRGDPAAAPAVLAALDAPEPAVRLAALSALETLGNANAIDTLAQAATEEDREVQQAARRSLERMPGEDVSDALVSRLRRAEPPAQAEILRALAGRGAVEAVPAIIRQTSGGEATVREEAYRALGMLAGEDHVDDVIRCVQRAKTDADRDQAARALVAAARRTPPEKGPAKPLLDALADNPKTPVAVALIGALAGIGDSAALGFLRAHAADAAPETRGAAVRALAAWPTSETMEDLRAIAANAPDAGDRSAALDGYVRLLRADTALDAAAKADRYLEAMAVADGAAAKRRILAGLGDLNDPRALDVLDQFADDADLGNEARAAAEKVRRLYYTAKASNQPDLAGLAFDNNIDSRWTSNAWQKPGIWFELDLSREADIRGIVLDTTRSAEDFPRGYQVHAYTDPENLGTAIATGQGEGPVTEITFEPVRARYIRIVQTGESESRWWSIDELRVLPK